MACFCAVSLRSKVNQLPSTNTLFCHAENVLTFKKLLNNQKLFPLIFFKSKIKIWALAMPGVLLATLNTLHQIYPGSTSHLFLHYNNSYIGATSCLINVYNFTTKFTWISLTSLLSFLVSLFTPQETNFPQTSTTHPLTLTANLSTTPLVQSLERMPPLSHSSSNSITSDLKILFTRGHPSCPHSQKMLPPPHHCGLGPLTHISSDSCRSALSCPLHKEPLSSH